MKINLSPTFKRFIFASKRNELDDSYYMASQWRLMLRKLRNHKLARISMFVLFFLYLGAIFAPFLSPQGLTSYDGKYVNMPPTRLHMMDEEGRIHGRPFVYGIKSTRDPETLRKIYEEDRTKRYPLRFMVKGESYRILGLIPSDNHLFGVEQPGQFFLFGTDSMGRDLFSRVLLGSQISLTIPLAGVLISMILGVTIGAVSGYFGGWIDSVIQRVIEIIRSFPTLPLWMALSAAIPPEIPVVTMFFYITIILSFIEWTGLARTVRSKFISLKNEDYIMAAKIAGVGSMKIITRHMVPGFMSYLLVSITLAVPAMILGETAMSFLGLGIRSPATSWGVLIQEAQQIQNVALYPWKLIPLGFIIATVLAFNFFGDGLRDAADPYK
ncbi:ABC transporter permease [Paenibacillus hamazuiensis]|uniref:ABC transporter permease n=1 Tax=Paenibacillus hamazuiensis TaxID=2936508 RepID=UPI00200F5919|nr:ABC transporter permease [Paenibacillus hamazuiensis]